MKRMEATEKVIDGNVFYIRPFGAFTAANISGELSAVVAPILGTLGPLIGEIKPEMEDGTDSTKTMEEKAENAAADILNMDIEEAMPVLTSAFSSISGDKFEHLMKRLLVDYQNISVEGEATDGTTKILNKDLADEIFCGELQDMVILCFEVIKVNFGGFFKKLANRSGKQRAGTQTTAPIMTGMASSI